MCLKTPSEAKRATQSECRQYTSVCNTNFVLDACLLRFNGIETVCSVQLFTVYNVDILFDNNWKLYFVRTTYVITERSGHGAVDHKIRQC